MVSNLIIAIEFSLVLAVLLVVKAILLSTRRPSLPPGPSGLPLVGNVLDMPTAKEWLTFAQWGETYGESLVFPMIYWIITSVSQAISAL